MQKIEKNNVTVYAIGDMELESLLWNASADDLVRIALWMRECPYLQTSGELHYVLKFPTGEIDLKRLECPGEFCSVIEAFLTHTAEERQTRPVYLEVDLPRSRRD